MDMVIRGLSMLCFLKPGQGQTEVSFPQYFSRTVIMGLTHKTERKLVHGKGREKDEHGAKSEAGLRIADCGLLLGIIQVLDTAPPLGLHYGVQGSGFRGSEFDA